MFAVIGLGNPGQKYQDTRHNVGFWAVEDFVAQYAGLQGVNSQGASSKRVGTSGGARSRTQTKEIAWEKRSGCLVFRAVVENEDVLFVLPQKYMNLSGEAAGPVISFYKIAPENIIVVYDEVDLTPGSLVLKKGGSAAGHRGVENIIQHLGTDDFYRVRIGVGHPSAIEGPERDMDVADWVLARPGPEEKELLKDAVLRAQEAVKTLIKSGFLAAQQQYNKRKLNKV